jgi:phosphatidylglycerol---prolipoprotein diacylglyceryl transferase
VYLNLAGYRVHPHLFFEGMGYLVAIVLFLWLRRRQGDRVEFGLRWSIVAAAFAGGAVGSKVLYWAEDPRATLAHWHDPVFLMGGKTIVGGLIGGWLAVEAMKHYIGISTRTGDLFAIPAAVGIAIGRIGCFLTGLSDQTYGTPTSLPWGVDFGDGIRRHPTQLYEMVFLLLLATVLARMMARKDPKRTPAGSGRREGEVFRVFIIGYMGFRVLVEFIKPVDPAVALGMTSIQWASLGGLLLACWQLRRPAALVQTSEAGL